MDRDLPSPSCFLPWFALAVFISMMPHQQWGYWPMSSTVSIALHVDTPSIPIAYKTTFSGSVSCVTNIWSPLYHTLWLFFFSFPTQRLPDGHYVGLTQSVSVGDGHSTRYQLSVSDDLSSFSRNPLEKLTQDFFAFFPPLSFDSILTFGVLVVPVERRVVGRPWLLTSGT